MKVASENATRQHGLGASDSWTGRQRYREEVALPSDRSLSDKRFVRLALLVLFCGVNVALVTTMSGVITPPSATIVLLMKVVCIVAAATALSYEDSIERVRTTSLGIIHLQRWRSALYGIAALGWMTNICLTSEFLTR